MCIRDSINAEYMGTIRELKKKIAERLNLSFYRVALSYENTPLSLDEKKLSEVNINEDATIVYKDLGPQIDWRTVYILEYLGPLLIQPALYYFSGPKHLVQKVAFGLAMFHFIKRILESAFLHVFSKETMPLYGSLRNYVYYWLWFGLGTGVESYFFWKNPKYPSWVIYALAGLFLVFQFLNFQCHKTLASFRKPKANENAESEEVKSRRGIPTGWGFDTVSCANYFWEICIWTTYAVLNRTKTSYAFVLTTIYVLVQWALKRHRRYRKEFDGKEGRPLYPKNRKAIIPFII
eukprot:TRINITY_DN9483_c0_g1_i2.p1 TRINITY_DN9483_c0_g1~~TRINITY_DN9483_c0_g1_i2.p1  ORF type:complete len:316 (+),score=91.32 TRINITY_DN9483_c0_g1_i2:73-948(+)